MVVTCALLSGRLPLVDVCITDTLPLLHSDDAILSWRDVITSGSPHDRARRRARRLSRRHVEMETVETRQQARSSVAPSSSSLNQRAPARATVGERRGPCRGDSSSGRGRERLTAMLRVAVSDLHNRHTGTVHITNLT